MRLAVAALAVLAAGPIAHGPVAAEQVTTAEEPDPDPIGMWAYGQWFNPETNSWEEPDDYTQGIGFEFVSGPEPVLFTGSFVLLDPLSAGDCTVVGFTFDSEIDPGDPRLVTPPGTSPVVAWEGTATDICGDQPVQEVDVEAALLDDGRLLIGWSTFVRVGCAVPASGFSAPTSAVSDESGCSSGCSRVEGSVVRIVGGPQWLTPHILVPIPSGWTVDVARSNGLNCHWPEDSGIVTISFQPRPSYTGEDFFAVGYNEVRITLEWTRNPDQSIVSLVCADSVREDALCTDGDVSLLDGAAAWTEDYRLCLPDAEIAVVNLQAEGVALYDDPDNEASLEVRGVALYGAGPARPLADFCDDDKSLSESQTTLAGEFRSGLVEILGGIVLEGADTPGFPEPSCARVDGDVVRMPAHGGELLVPIPAGWEVDDFTKCAPKYIYFTRQDDQRLSVHLSIRSVVNSWRDFDCLDVDELRLECTVTNTVLPHDGNLALAQHETFCVRTVDRTLVRGEMSSYFSLTMGRLVFESPGDEEFNVVVVQGGYHLDGIDCDDDYEPMEPFVRAGEVEAAVTHIVTFASLE